MEPTTIANVRAVIEREITQVQNELIRYVGDFISSHCQMCFDLKERQYANSC